MKVAKGLETLERERVAQRDLLAAKEKAVAVELDLIAERHRETEESFAVQKNYLNEHISGTYSFLQTFCVYYLETPIILKPRYRLYHLHY